MATNRVAIFNKIQLVIDRAIETVARKTPENILS